MNAMRQPADLVCTWSADGLAIRVRDDNWVTRGELPMRLLCCRNSHEARVLAQTLAGRHSYEHGLIIEAFRMIASRQAGALGYDHQALTRALAAQLQSRGEREASACASILPPGMQRRII